MASSNSSQPRSMVDEVTPYKIGILVLVDEYCKILKRKSDGDLSLEDTMNEEQERELLIRLLHLVQGADINLFQLIQNIRVFVKPSLINALTGRMKLMMEDGIHAMMDLFKDLPASLFGESGPLHRSSILGLFLRRMVIAFNKLMFNQINRLHREFSQFYESWSKESGGPATEMSALDATMEASSLMDVLDDESHCTPDHGDDCPPLHSTKYSHRQGELFIAQQTFLLQHSPTVALMPKELQEKLNSLLMNNPAISEAHYLSYLNNLRLNEYCGAQLNLHHFFDRQLVAGSKGKNDEDLFPRGYRYAALNMASLHYTFGHRAESLAALQEAIQLAQEANDHVCLQHALGWLQRLSEQGTGSSAYMLERLVNKAGELNLAYLTSLGVQSFAKHNALATAQPASVFEFLLKSDIVNCQHSLCDLKCVSYAQKAALWSLYGRREMCSLSGQGILMLNTSDLGVYHSGDAECTALCHMAQMHLDQGKMHHAALILKAAEERFPASSPQAKMWKLCEQQQKFALALYRGEYAEAESAITNMTALSPLQACFCRCLLLKEQGMVRAALDLSTSLRSQCEEKSQQDLPQLYVRLLLLQGELHCACGNAFGAPQPLLTCLTLCRQRHYSYLVALTTVHLALVQFYLDMPKQALLLIEEVLITILSHGSLYDQARASYLWIRCLLAAAAKQGTDAKREALFTAVQRNEKVLSCFRKVQAYRRTKDAVYFQARWYHELGFTAERNKCAHEFKELDLQYPTWKPMDVCCL